MQGISFKATLLIISIVVCVVLLTDTFLFPLRQTIEILKDYSSSTTYSSGRYGGSTNSYYLYTGSGKKYKVPFEVYCGISLGDTFVIYRTSIFCKVINIQYSYKGIIYKKSIGVLNYSGFGIGIICFILAMSLFSLLFPDVFSDDIQLRLSLILLCITIAAVVLYFMYQG